jgi:FMN phosphatase YigB (HAD superfamily)
MIPADDRAPLAASRGGAIACVALDYGGALTVAMAEHDRVLGMRPITAEAAAALHQLYELGLRLILASNTLPGQDRRPALVQAGVRHLFSHLVQSDQLGYAKPDEAFFRHVCYLAGHRPEQVLMVGNTMARDIEPAVQLGMPAVLIGGTVPCCAETDPCCVRLGSITELPALLAGATADD